MIGWLNIFSLLLGLIAWVLPIYNIINYQKKHPTRWVILSLVSMGACATSLCLQIFYNHYLVTIKDWSALMDITGGVAFAAGTLFMITIILNAVTVILYYNRG